MYEYSAFSINQLRGGGKRFHTLVKRNMIGWPNQSGFGDSDAIALVTRLYMVTAIAQISYLPTAEMKYIHGSNAMREKAIEAHCEAVPAFILR